MCTDYVGTVYIKPGPTKLYKTWTDKVLLSELHGDGIIPQVYYFPLRMKSSS